MIGSVFRKLFKTKNTEEDAPLKKEHSLKISLSNGVQLKVGNAQHQGARPYQEDSCGFSDLTPDIVEKKGMLAVLADGMGGLANGKAVSERVVAELLKWFNTSGECLGGESMMAYTEKINEAICDEFCPDGTIASGSTLVCALIAQDKLHWLCVGDSRLYLKRGARMYQINEDHDYLNKLLGEVLSGDLTVEDALNEPNKDCLVSCIGKRDLAAFDYSGKGLALEAGDKIVLCSDGVYNGISYEAFNNFLEVEPQAAAVKIAENVLKSRVPGQDNLTVIVMEYDKKQ